VRRSDKGEEGARLLRRGGEHFLRGELSHRVHLVAQLLEARRLGLGPQHAQDALLDTLALPRNAFYIAPFERLEERSTHIRNRGGHGHSRDRATRSRGQSHGANRFGTWPAAPRPLGRPLAGEAARRSSHRVEPARVLLAGNRGRVPAASFCRMTLRRSSRVGSDMPNGPPQLLRDWSRPTTSIPSSMTIAFATRTCSRALPRR
jgi:hypothetical protein